MSQLTVTTIKHPCNDCDRSLLQAILYDEIYCYRTCVAFKEWKESGRGAPRVVHIVEVAAK